MDRNRRVVHVFVVGVIADAFVLDCGAVVVVDEVCDRQWFFLLFFV